MDAIRTIRQRLPAILPSAFVLIGRASSGVLPVATVALASRSYGLDVMGELATAVMLAYATAEVADIFSQRHVPRLLTNGPTTASASAALAPFNGLRLLVLVIGFAVSVVVLYLTVPHTELWLYAAVAPAVWATLANMRYAIALAANDFASLSVGPVITLAAFLIVALVLAAIRPEWGVWNLVLALNVARAVEFAWLRRRQPWPGIRLDRGTLTAQWRDIRYLLLLMLLSSMHVRLVVPLVAALSGPAGAGVFSIGFTLLGVVSLSAVAITVPAYRRALTPRAPLYLAEAWQRTPVEFGFSLVTCGVLVLALWLGTPWLVLHIFGINELPVNATIRVILLGGLFEGLSLFAAVWYQACFRDRDLLVLSAISVVGGWVALIIGSYLAGLAGMAWAFVLTRAAAVMLLYQPVVASFLAKEHQSPQSLTETLGG